jgi:hypothetical protein
MSSNSLQFDKSVINGISALAPSFWASISLLGFFGKTRFWGVFALFLGSIGFLFGEFTPPSAYNL